MTWTAMTSSYWSNSDTISEVKLDAMVGNLNHLRDESKYKHFVSIGSWQAFPSGFVGAPSLDFEVKLDEAVIAQWTGTGDKSTDNISVGGITNGLYIVALELEATVGVYDYTERIENRIVVTDDIDYLSVWCTMDTGQVGSKYYPRIDNFSLIGHLENEATW